MRVHSVVSLFLVIAPTIENTDHSPEGIKEGAKERLGLRLDDGEAVFVLTGEGWKIAAKLAGSRYWPDDALNVR